MDSQFDKTITDFMNVTAKSNVAVIVPLYGFWNDIQDNPVNGEVLKITLDRLYSNVHGLYLIFIAHPQSLSTDTKDPLSVGNVLAAKSKMGNSTFLPIERTAAYVEYVAKGIEYALNETKAEFIVVFNPWTLIQHGAVDVLVDRCNQGDNAKVVSGFDIRSVIEPESFDNYHYTIPKEQYDLSFDFLAMPRFVAEMLEIDPNYKTHMFLQRDLWQQVGQRSFTPITTQRVVIFPFDFPWEDYEGRGEFEADREYFNGKWRFDPGIYYKDWSGATRTDKEPAR